MTLTQSVSSGDYINRAREISVHVGLLIVLTGACFLFLRPFIPLLAWGIIISIAMYPAYKKLRGYVGGRGNLAAVICTLVLLGALIVPAVLLTGTLIEGVQTLTMRMKEGKLIIPPPPASVETWPLVGAPLKRVWDLASENLTAAIAMFAPQIKSILPGLLSFSAGIGSALLQLILSIVVAGVLMATGSGGAKISNQLARRLFGERGDEFEKLAESTVRSVTTGIIGVALIQTFCAGLGFLIFGLPGAGLWAVMFLIAAVVQVGVVVLIPAVIYMFATAATTKAVIFLVWCIVVGLMDNVLKPLLLGRGVDVPIAVVFLGAIGGFIALGIIGLFVGAVLLSIGYKMCIGWLESPAVAAKGSGA